MRVQQLPHNWSCFCIQRAHFRALSIVLATFMLPVDYPAQEMYLLIFVGSKSKIVKFMGWFLPAYMALALWIGPLDIYIKFSKVHRDYSYAKEGHVLIAAFLEKVAIFFREKLQKIISRNLKGVWDLKVTRIIPSCIWGRKAWPKITPKSSSSAWARMSLQVAALLLVCPMSP